VTYSSDFFWCVTDMEKANSEYEKKSAFSADTRIRKYQVCEPLHICFYFSILLTHIRSDFLDIRIPWCLC